MPLPINRDCIAGDTRFRTGQQPFLAYQAISQCGLPDIGTTDDGELQGVFTPDSRSIARPGIWRQALVKLGQTLAMLGGDRHRIAEAQLIGSADCWQCRAAFGLVRQEHNRFARAPQPIGKMAVGLSNTFTRVDDEQRDIDIGERTLGLRLHPLGQRSGGGLLETGCIYDAESQVGDPSLTLAPIAGDTRRIVDEGEPPADKPVEQRGFSDIRASEYHYRKTHDGDPPRQSFQR
jgi:hypothetical protein